MDVTSQTIKTYQSKEGRAPFNEWMNSLRSDDTRAIIDNRMARLRRGLFGDVKWISQGVFELRIDLGPGYRVYFGKEPATVILLTGGQKATQRRDIEKAKAYWADYLGRRQP